jgi:hypothetical protein
MKVIKVPVVDPAADRSTGYEIQTPWLRAEEAARYLGVSRAFFDSAAAASGLRHGWEGRCKVYHTDDLDRLCLGKVCDAGGDASGQSDTG